MSPVLSLLYLFNKQQKLRALECLNQVGLISKSYSRTDHLSGGQQQRVGIARALSREPIMILLMSRLQAWIQKLFLKFYLY